MIQRGNNWFSVDYRQIYLEERLIILNKEIILEAAGVQYEPVATQIKGTALLLHNAGRAAIDFYQISSHESE